MRIIRINSCSDCPQTRGGYTCHLLWITQPDNADVIYYANTKTIPDNCPLEEDNIVGKSHTEVGADYGSAK